MWIGLLLSAAALWLGLQVYISRAWPASPRWSDEIATLQAQIAALEAAVGDVREFDKDTVRLQRVAKAAALLRPWQSAQRAVERLSLEQLEA